MSTGQIYSLTSARKMVPYLRSIAMSIIDTWAAIIKIRETKELNQEQKDSLNALIDQINIYIKEVEDLGCFAQEFKRGIIVIPSLRAGMKVFLNWYPQDETVEFWHHIDEMFADRKMLNQKDLEVWM